MGMFVEIRFSSMSSMLIEYCVWLVLRYKIAVFA